MISGATILSAIIGGTIVRTFGNEIDGVNDHVRKWIDKWYPPLDDFQKKNLQIYTENIALKQSIDYTEISPSISVMMLEWINFAKNVNPLEEKKIGNVYKVALERLLEGNYDLVNSLKQLTVDELRDLGAGSPIHWMLAKKLEGMRLGYIESPSFKFNPGYPSSHGFGAILLIIFVALFFSALVILLGHSLLPQFSPYFALGLGIIVFIIFALWMRALEKSYNPEIFGARFFYAKNFNFRLSWGGKHILYDMFPDTYTRKEGQWIHGEPFIAVLPEGEISEII